MIARERLKAAERGRTAGQSPKERFCTTLGLAAALATLPPALEWRTVGLQLPAYGECRLKARLAHDSGGGLWG